MTKEERLDWLCRLRSFLVTVDIPKDWRTNFDQALSEEIEPTHLHDMNVGDMISRQQAVELIERMKPYHQDADDIAEMIDNMPPAQPEQYWIDSEGNVSTLPFAQKTGKWIPVTERLPKDGEEVFVYLFNPKSPYIAWVEDGCWYTEEFKVNRKYEPLAWMPLPEPYKGEQA